MRTLTTQIASWLAEAKHQDMLLIDYLTVFMREFNLTPEEAGHVLGQWLRVTYSKAEVMP